MNKNIGKYGNKFSSTNQPKNPGRKKSQLKDFVKTCNVSSSDVIKVFQHLIFGSTVEELKELVKPANQGKQPVIVILLIKAFLEDMKNGTLREANTVLDRVLGKPVQQLTIENAVSEIPEDPEERRKLTEDLQKELGVFREDVSKED
jgi:hypothetical protein